MFRVRRSNRLLIPGIAAVAAFAFLLASNYCVSEAFTGEHAHPESSHQHTSTGHHDDKTPTSQDQSDPCCSTLLAAVSSPGIFQIASSTPTLLTFLASLGAEVVLRTQLTTVPSGLSPPAQAPPPRLPFYRTAFASHAPPVCLAETDALAL